MPVIFWILEKQKHVKNIIVLNDSKTSTSTQFKKQLLLLWYFFHILPFIYSITIWFWETVLRLNKWSALTSHLHF